MFVVLPVIPMHTHAATSICTTVPGAACITFGKNPEERRTTSLRVTLSLTDKLALDTRSEVIASSFKFESEGCKVIVK